MAKNLEDDSLYLDAESVLDEIVAYLKRVSTRNETAFQELNKSLNRCHPSAGETVRKRRDTMADRCYEVNTIFGAVQDMIAHHRRLAGKK